MDSGDCLGVTRQRDRQFLSLHHIAKVHPRLGRFTPYRAHVSAAANLPTMIRLLVFIGGDGRRGVRPKRGLSGRR
jgi:hypothetical protein